MEYQIISDGCCDFTQEQIEEYGVRVIPFYVSFDAMKYQKEITEIGIREVYDRMIADPTLFPKTSLPSITDYMDVFQECYDKGEACICICFTPSLSGSYNSACNAKEIFIEDNPDAQISVINSESGTVSQALFVIEASKLKKAGVPYEEAVRRLESLKETSHIFFTTADTKYLQKGGRIGKLATAALDRLAIKPMITLERGVIEPSGIGRSRIKTRNKTLELMNHYFSKHGHDPHEYTFAVGYGYDIEEGKAFYEKAVEAVHELAPEKEVLLVQIGATTACHTGPHAIGIGVVREAKYYE